MKHEDFEVLDLAEVLTKFLTYVSERSKASAVHWISAHGLERVHDSTVEQWNWALAAADIVGNHMWSQPASDSWSLYQMWRQVDDLYPRPWMGTLAPHRMTDPLPRFVLPVYFKTEFLGVVALDNPRETNPLRLIESLRLGLDMASKYLHFAYKYLEAKNLSYVDELTGLHNQRYLPMVLDHEIQRAKRENTKFSLLFLDIDYFKLVNDGRGHWVGSKLLIAVGEILKNCVRTCDYTFRYGGDEFIVVLGHADLEGAKIVGERIRQAVENTTFQVEGHALNLTVSIGLATYPQHAQSVADLIQIADQAMYDGKRKSRNIVFVAS